MSVETPRHGTRVPWGDVVLSAIASVSWALIGMAGTAALGLHLLEADTAGSLGPMTAAVVALGAGGSVTPSGDVSAFGLSGAQANTAIEITPLGVSLVGALLLSWFFLRSLRTAGVVIAPAELLARAGTVVALFVAMLGGLVWAGHDVITIDGGALGLDDLPGGSGGGGLEIPGLGDVGDIGGLLPDRVGDLIDAKAAVGFTVDTAPTLLGGLGWSAGILLIALLASRRSPLPRGWEAVHRVVRPAVSALVAVLLVAVAAGLAAAAYAAIGDDHPKRIAGAALLGAPNGTWLGIPVGLFVPFDGQATGVLTRVLPDPLDDLLTAKSDQSVTLGRLAELDGRVWLLGVAAAVMMLLAGVLTAVRTPVGAPVHGGGAGALGFAGRCALRLGLVTALTLPLLAWLTEVSVDASLSVLGFDAFGAGVEIRGHLGMALVLGALWGAGAGAAAALLAHTSGAAGKRAAPLALGVVARTTRSPASGDGGPTGEMGYGDDAGLRAGGPGGSAGEAGPYGGGAGSSAGEPAGRGGGAGPYAGEPGAQGGGPGAYAGEPGLHAGQLDASGGGAGPYAGRSGGSVSGPAPYAGRPGPYAGEPDASGSGAGPYAGEPGPYTGRPEPDASGAGPAPHAGQPGPYAGEPGPYVPGKPYRPPNPATNPYLQMPDELREPEDARPPNAGRPGAGDARSGAGGTWRGAEGTPPRAGDARSGAGSGRPGSGNAQSQRPAAPPEGPPPADAGEKPRRGGSPPPHDVYGAPTVAQPIEPQPRSSQQQPPRSGRGDRRSPASDDGPPPPPPPPPPAPPRRPKGPR
jgi:hypothetical protein